MTHHEIAEALKHNGYEAATAAARAILVLAFFETTGLEQRLTAHPSLAPRRQLEFLTGDATCTINNADVVTFAIAHPPKTKWLGGTWLDTAPLTYLARVCDIGHRQLGENWTDKVKKRLANRESLLDVLNEVWWLGCWKDIKNVKASPKVEAGGDNDWHVVFGYDFSVTLQVKRRRSDLVRIVHHTRPPFGLFDKVSKRFPNDRNRMNVGAITIYAGITPPVLRAVDDYFRSTASEGVDAIVLWCPASPPHLSAFFIRERSSNKKLHEHFQLDPFDDLYETHNIHPLSIDEAVSGDSNV